MKPSFSIITVTYNCVDTIERTIRSVVTQSYEDIEYIIIDGSSTDGTREIIEKYQSFLAYYSSEQDTGVYNAMNKALIHVKNDIVFFLGGDDYFLDDKVIERIANVFDDTKADIIISRIVDDYGISGPPPLRSGKCPYYKMGFPHQATFSKHQIYHQIGGFDEGYHISADYEWILRAIYHDANICTTDILTARYSSGGLSDSEGCIIEMYCISDAYMKKSGYDIEQIRDMRRHYFDVFCGRVLERDIINTGFTLYEGVLPFIQRIKNRGCYVWGCGRGGRMVLSLLRQYSVNVKGFFDNDTTLHGTICDGVYVDKYDGLETGDIIISSIYSSNAETEISNTLQGSGLKHGIDFFLFRDVTEMVLEGVANYYAVKGGGKHACSTDC